MVTRVYSGGVHGVEGYIVNVEADISDGMPMFELGGNLGSEVREAKDRVRGALRNIGYTLPVKRITINLSPADRKKYGTSYDLPIAVSVLRALNVVGNDAISETFFAGELMLSGKICPVKGILPMVLNAKMEGLKRCIIPKENEKEGSIVEGIDVIGVNDLEEVIEFLRGEIIIGPAVTNFLQNDIKYEYDLETVSGQLLARRGLEIAAAGYHNVLMIGPPGAGKSLLAKCIPSIMPPLTMEEKLQISAIYSVGGRLDANEGMINQRPFVAPHHTSTEISLIGGGAKPRPGAVSYAGKGVLFMDEFPEFSRSSLEVLRQPLEDRKVTITRNLDTIEYPADFMLVAAMNPCPCGAYPDIGKCICTPAARIKYTGKLSKPLLDRIDICMEVEKVSTSELIAGNKFESSKQIRERVITATNIQKERFNNLQINFNSQMKNKEVETFCSLGNSQKKTMSLLIDKYSLSARGYYRTLKVARTIADLEGSDNIKDEHLFEALRLKCNSMILSEV